MQTTERLCKNVAFGSKKIASYEETQKKWELVVGCHRVHTAQMPSMSCSCHSDAVCVIVCFSIRMLCLHFLHCRWPNMIIPFRWNEKKPKKCDLLIIIISEENWFRRCTAICNAQKYTKFFWQQILEHQTVFVLIFTCLPRCHVQTDEPRPLF